VKEKIFLGILAILRFLNSGHFHVKAFILKIANLVSLKSTDWSTLLRWGRMGRSWKKCTKKQEISFATPSVTNMAVSSSFIVHNTRAGSYSCVCVRVGMHVPRTLTRFFFFQFRRLTLSRPKKKDEIPGPPPPTSAERLVSSNIFLPSTSGSTVVRLLNVTKSERNHKKVAPVRAS